MNGKNDDLDDVQDDASSEDISSEDLTATVVISEDGIDDADGDTTIEMDIEKLVAKLDASDSDDVHRRAEIRRKLEELREQREAELDSTFNFNLNED